MPYGGQGHSALLSPGLVGWIIPRFTLLLGGAVPREMAVSFMPSTSVVGVGVRLGWMA